MNIEKSDDDDERSDEEIDLENFISNQMDEEDRIQSNSIEQNASNELNELNEITNNSDLTNEDRMRLNVGIDNNLLLFNGISGSKDPIGKQLKSLISNVDNYKKNKEDDETENDLMKKFGVVFKNMTVYRRSNSRETTENLNPLESFQPVYNENDLKSNLFKVLSAAGRICPDNVVSVRAKNLTEALKFFTHSIIFPFNNIERDKCSKECLWLLFKYDDYTMVLQNRAELRVLYSGMIGKGILTRNENEDCANYTKNGELIKIPLPKLLNGGPFTPKEHDFKPQKKSRQEQLKDIREKLRSDRDKYVTGDNYESTRKYSYIVNEREVVVIEKIKGNTITTCIGGNEVSKKLPKRKQTNGNILSLDLFFKPKGKKSKDITKNNDHSVDVKNTIKNPIIIDSPIKDPKKTLNQQSNGWNQKYPSEVNDNDSFQPMCKSELIVYDNSTNQVFTVDCYIKYRDYGMDIYLFYDDGSNSLFFKFDLTKMAFKLYGIINSL